MINKTKEPVKQAITEKQLFSIKQISILFRKRDSGLLRKVINTEGNVRFSKFVFEARRQYL